MKQGVITNCFAANVYRSMDNMINSIEFLRALSKVEILDDIDAEDYALIDNLDGTYCYEPIQANGFLKVKTESGNVGYVQKRYLAIREDDST